MNIARRAGLTLLPLLVLGACVLTAKPAHAQTTQINDASGLSAGDTTLTYTGTQFAEIPSYSDTAGGQTVTLTDTGNGFFFGTQGSSYGGAFPIGTNVLATDDGSGNATGPLTITFSSGVTELGFSAENAYFGMDTFTFTAFNGATPLGTFTAGPTNNLTVKTLTFIGVQETGGPLITSLLLSSTSSNTGDSDFGVGPLTFGVTPSTSTPEPASYAAFAMGGLGLLGLGLKARMRRLSA